MTGARGPDVRHEFGDASRWSVAITIPARNEARRIVPCLEAAAASLKSRGGIVVAVNGSVDETFARTAAWFEATGASGIVLDERSPPAGSGVGRARRHAIAACSGRLTPRATVMTSDADSRVAADFVDANLADLEGADLVCGRVLPDPDEFARLPAAIGRRGAVEGEYVALTLAARALLDPVPHDPDPVHLNEAGASLAFRMDLHDDVGGIPDLEIGEDRAFGAEAERRGWRVRHSARVMVTTACRLHGRTSGGMAGALRARLVEDDPLVDELLAPAAVTIERARRRGVLRRRCGSQAAFAAAWAEVADAPALQSSRLRLSDLYRELPRLAAALAELEPLAEKRSA